MPCNNFNTGNVGLLFERLLGLENHNFSIPDYNGIEIKTKIINSIPKMTLFNASPDGYLYSTKNLYESYGYPDRHNKNYKVFNQSFSATKRTYVNKCTFGKLHVDRKNKLVMLVFYDNNYNIINNDTSWSFDMLQQKMDIKLKQLLIMYAKRSNFNGTSYCKYLRYDFFHYKGFDYFLNAIEKGYIKITFAIDVFKKGPRIGKVHDHGTSFDIDTRFIKEIFKYIEI